MQNKKYRLNKIKVCLALLCAGISVLASKRPLESLSDSGPSKKLKHGWIQQYQEENNVPLDLSIKKGDNSSSIIALAPQPLPKKLFRNIDESSILKVFICISSSIVIDTTQYYLDSDSKIKETRQKLERRNPDVIWIGVTKSMHNYYKTVEFIFSCSPHNTSYILQWIEKTETDDAFARRSLSAMLSNAYISEYTGQFLLFVDPTSGFLKKGDEHSNLYTFLQPILQNYSSIYILHTEEDIVSKSALKRKIHQKMNYSLLLHKNIKCYGAVSLHSDVQLPLLELVKSSIENICLDTLVIHQKHAGKGIHFYNPFSCFNPLHLDISFNAWEKIKVDCKSSSIELDKLTIRDILLDSSAMSTSSSSQEEASYYPFKINSSDCIRDMFISSYKLYRNLFSISYPCILETDLYFIASASSASFSFTPTHLCKLFAFSAFFFFNTSELRIHLPSTCRIDDDLGVLTNSSEPLTCSESFKDKFRRFYTGCIEKNLIHNSNLQSMEKFLSNPSTASLDITFRKSWNRTNSTKIDPLFSSIQDLCSIMSSAGYFLATSNTTTLTISNGTQTHVLHALNNISFIAISIENKKQVLYFRHFSLLQQQ